MPSRRFFLRSATAFFAAGALLCGPARADEPIQVVATFSILGDMVARVGGAHIALTTLVGPDGDAHVYQPTPQAAAAMSRADVLFMNGLEFEGWLERLAEAASFDGRMVVTTEGIQAIAYEDQEDHEDHDARGHDDHAEEEHAEGEHDEGEHALGEDHDDDHDHGDEDHAEAKEHGDEDHDDHDHDAEDHASDDHADHEHGAFDPHAWQTVENAVIYVNTITAALVSADPSHAADYEANRDAYLAELASLEAEIDALMAAIPAERRTIVTSHDAFGYLGARYGLRFEAPQGLSTESEASAADVAALITQIREEGISAVFVETLTDNRLLEQIANETGAQIGGALYTGALSGPDGPAPTYIDMMRHNAMTLSQALAGS